MRAPGGRPGGAESRETTQGDHSPSLDPLRSPTARRYLRRLHPWISREIAAGSFTARLSRMVDGLVVASEAGR